MDNKESALINKNNKNTNDPLGDCKKGIDCVKELENPHCFVCDGVTVRVSFEGKADLNDLVKDLFLFS